MIEPRITYYVAEERARGTQVRHWDPFPTPASADGEAESFNQEEAELARLERREVGVRYFVVKATTTYEEMT